MPNSKISVLGYEKIDNFTKYICKTIRKLLDFFLKKMLDFQNSIHNNNKTLNDLAEIVKRIRANRLDLLESKSKSLLVQKCLCIFIFMNEITKSIIEQIIHYIFKVSRKNFAWFTHTFQKKIVKHLKVNCNNSEIFVNLQLQAIVVTLASKPRYGNVV